MSSYQSRKKLNLEYKGTIVPLVGKLMNQCKGMEREFRIVSEKMLEDEKKASEPVQSFRMTIVVDMDSGEYIRHFWG